MDGWVWSRNLDVVKITTTLEEGPCYCDPMADRCSCPDVMIDDFDERRHERWRIFKTEREAKVGLLAHVEAAVKRKRENLKRHERVIARLTAQLVG